MAAPAPASAQPQPKVAIEPVMPFTMVSRQEWGADDPEGYQRPFQHPVESVVWSYTETDECFNKTDCMALMKKMQKAHMDEGLPDIKFNFVLGRDGVVYEGSGWKTRAPFNINYPDLEGNHIEFAHTGKRGDFPYPEQVTLINQLFEYGQAKNLIDKNAKANIDYLWSTDCF